MISIPADIPEDTKETLKQKLNIWTVGAVYVYDTETAGHDNTVITSFEETGYNSDEYSYEVVSGLSGIWYPAAIILSADEKPEFVIPMQKSTTYTFTGERSTVVKSREKTVIPLNAQDSNNDNINGLSIYHYDDVVRVSNSYNQSGVRLPCKKGITEKNTIAVSVLGATGILLIVRTKKRNKKRVK